MSRIIQYTADDEEPECRNCDNQDGQKVCDHCGPEYGWSGYIRSDLEVEKMRLIDADRLKEAIHTDFSEHFTLYHDTDQTALIDMVMDDIDEMPTAFDKENVIEELKSPYNYAIMAGKHVTTVDRSVEIVEKGGIE